MIVNRF